MRWCRLRRIKRLELQRLREKKEEEIKEERKTVSRSKGAVALGCLRCVQTAEEKHVSNVPIITELKVLVRTRTPPAQ